MLSARTCCSRPWRGKKLFWVEFFNLRKHSENHISIYEELSRLSKFEINFLLFTQIIILKIGSQWTKLPIGSLNCLPSIALQSNIGATKYRLSATVRVQQSKCFSNAPYCSWALNWKNKVLTFWIFLSPIKILDHRKGSHQSGSGRWFVWIHFGNAVNWKVRMKVIKMFLRLPKLLAFQIERKKSASERTLKSIKMRVVAQRWTAFVAINGSNKVRPFQRASKILFVY